MSRRSCLQSKLFRAVFGVALCGLPITVAPADSLSGTNTLETIEHGDAKGDWVEYWSDKRDAIWMIVVHDHKVVDVQGPGDTVDAKAKAALLKQRGAESAAVTAAEIEE